MSELTYERNLHNTKMRVHAGDAEIGILRRTSIEWVFMSGVLDIYDSNNLRQIADKLDELNSQLEAANADP